MQYNRNKSDIAFGMDVNPKGFFDTLINCAKKQGTIDPSEIKKLE